MAGLPIQSGAAANELTVENTVARVSLNDRNGNPVSFGDASQMDAGQQGVSLVGGDWRTNRRVRVMSDGQLSTQCQLMFSDNMEGVAVNTNKWLQTLTTHTVTASGGQLLVNAGSSIATTTGALHVSLNKFPIPQRGRLAVRSRQNLSAHQAGHVYEMGFGAPTSATVPAAVGDGAFWQKDAAGTWKCVVMTGNSAFTIAANLSDAAFNAAIGGATKNFFLEVEVSHGEVVFRLLRHDGTIGAEFSDATSGNGVSGFTGFQAHKLAVFFRELNQAATASAVQLRQGAITVRSIDSGLIWTPNMQAAFDGRGTHQNPVNGFTTLANYTKDTAPTARTLVGTAAGEVAAGGLLVANAMAGGNTDLLMFGIQNTSNYTLMLQGVTIPPPLNQVVAVATTQTTFEYFLALNSSSASLAAGSPRFVGLPGFHTAPIALAAGGQFSGSNIVYEDDDGVAIQPGRFLQIGCRALFGTATATETFLWNVLVKGKYV